ncbi:unknown [Bacteroides sp. CAG:875]|nr:unknown [Bacteroides sp. CAG:875]
MAGNAFDRIPLLVAGEALGSQGDSLIQFHVVTDNTGSPDDHTRAVVNGEVVSDLGTRMDVDTCFGMGHLGDDAWDKRHVKPVKFVGNPVVGHGSDDRIATDDFSEARSRWVTVIGSLYVRGQDAADFR